MESMHKYSQPISVLICVALCCTRYLSSANVLIIPQLSRVGGFVDSCQSHAETHCISTWRLTCTVKCLWMSSRVTAVNTNNGQSVFIVYFGWNHDKLWPTTAWRLYGSWFIYNFTSFFSALFMHPLSCMFWIAENRWALHTFPHDGCKSGHCSLH